MEEFLKLVKNLVRIWDKSKVPRFLWPMVHIQTLSAEVRPKHEVLQELNYSAEELIRTSPADQAALIREPLADVNTRSESLQHNIARKMVSFLL